MCVIEYMRVKFVERIGVPAVFLIALAVVTLYSLWGATLLQ